MRIIYNANLPVISKIEKSILKKVEIKNNYRQIELNNFLQLEKENLDLIKLIKSCPLINDRKKILVDIQVKEYKVGEYTCANKYYHLDGKRYIKPRNKLNDNRYHICILEGPTTEFIKHPFGFFYATNVNQQNLINYLGIDYMYAYCLPLNTWNSYGEFHWHRGRQIFKDCKRIFIKVTETNYIKESKYR